MAFVQFAAPALLIGVAAVAIPVVVHLLLRPKPRRVLFPPVGFLRQALASGQRAQRLRNVRLLILRALLLVAAAFVLAGPTCAPSSATPGAVGPEAHVLIVDDSWSMRYRVDAETTLLDAAESAAKRLCRFVADRPGVSRAGLIWADPSRPGAELSEDFAAIRGKLREPSAATSHAHPLGGALREAAGMLQSADEPVRKLTVFTDLAAHAWRDTDAGVLTGIDNLRVTVRSPASDRRSNIALTAATGPRWIHPENSPIPLHATLSSAGLDASVYLSVRENGRVVERLGPFAIPADGTRDVDFVLPPRSRGAHALTLEIEPSDRLDFDQQRHVAFQIGEKPVAWLVAASEGDDDLTTVLLKNLLAPELLKPEQQRVALRTLSPRELGRPIADNPDSETKRTAALIVVPGDVDLNKAARLTIRRQAERGATVLLIPGSDDRSADWPGLRRLLARSMLPVETLESVMTISWTPGSAFAGVSEDLDEIQRVAVRRRAVPAGLEAGAVIEARYADGVAAILSKRIGRGRVVMLTTSPDPNWSDLGRRAAGLLTWLHVMLREAVGPPDLVASWIAGQEANGSFPGLPQRGVARVVRQTADESEAASVRLTHAEPTRGGWPSDVPGVYTVRAGRSDAIAGLYTVNWLASESDLAKIDEDRLEALLGVEDVRIADGTLLDRAGGPLLFRLIGVRDAASLLPLALVGLLLWELRLANRSRGHEQAPQPVNPSHPESHDRTQ